MTYHEATYRNKRGQVLDRQFAPTREEAARLLLERNPNAKSVQCCNASFDEASGEMRGNGMNISWIGREGRAMVAHLKSLAFLAAALMVSAAVTAQMLPTSAQTMRKWPVRGDWVVHLANKPLPECDLFNFRRCENHELRVLASA